MSCPENRYIYLRDIMYERLPHLRSFQIHADGYSKRTALEPEDPKMQQPFFLVPGICKTRREGESGRFRNPDAGSFCCD